LSLPPLPDLHTSTVTDYLVSTAGSGCRYHVCSRLPCTLLACPTHSDLHCLPAGSPRGHRGPVEGGSVTPSDYTLCLRFAGIVSNNNIDFHAEPGVLPCDFDGSHAMFYDSGSFAGRGGLPTPQTPCGCDRAGCSGAVIRCLVVSAWRVLDSAFSVGAGPMCRRCAPWTVTTTTRPYCSKRML
jgi:hypothetical protein